MKKIEPKRNLDVIPQSVPTLMKKNEVLTSMPSVSERKHYSDSYIIYVFPIDFQILHIKTRIFFLQM